MFYQLTWLGSEKKEVIEGNSFAEAFNDSYGGGAIRALDYYKQITPPTEGWVLVGTMEVGRMLKEVFNHPEFLGLEKVRMVKPNGIRTKGLVQRAIHVFQ